MFFSVFFGIFHLSVHATSTRESKAISYLRRLKSAILPRGISSTVRSLLIRFHNGIRKLNTQQNEPNGQQNQTIDGRIPIGNFSKGPEAVESQNLGDKVQHTEQTNKQTNEIPARSKGRLVRGTPSPDRNMDKEHDKEYGNPFKGINKPNQPGSHNVRDFQRLPAQSIIRVGRNPIIEIKSLRTEFMSRQTLPHVQKSTNPFGKGARQGQDGNANVQPDTFGTTMRQDPGELYHGNGKKEPGTGVHKSSRLVKDAILVSKVPFLLQIIRVQLVVKL